jgi:hypothetical protein
VAAGQPHVTAYPGRLQRDDPGDRNGLDGEVLVAFEFASENRTDFALSAAALISSRSGAVSAISNVPSCMTQAPKHAICAALSMLAVSNGAEERPK